MTTSEFALVIIAVILFITTTVLLILYIKQKMDIKNLTNDINSFIEEGKLTDFSTSDNNFSKLQNSVSDLENLYKLEQHNTNIESKKNADFIADISHQLKTPLAGLRLYCEMEHSSNPSPHTEKELQLIEKMESLIYRLLILEKIKSDAYVMNFKYYNVEDIIKETVDEISPLFPLKEYSIKGSSKMRLDKTWLIEAFGNIIKNASEHTAENGKIEIIIEDIDNSTIITVNDNGGGVPVEELPKLFNRFHKAQNASNNSAGIGLAITKAIVEKHHGTISAENSSKGLSVIMCFPHIDGYITI